MDEARKKALIAEIQKEVDKDKQTIKDYLDSLVLKRNRTSLMMNSFMHNVIDIENSVETTKDFLK